MTTTNATSESGDSQTTPAWNRPTGRSAATHIAQPSAGGDTARSCHGSPDAMDVPWNWTACEVGSLRWTAGMRALGRWVEDYAERHSLWGSMPVCWYAHSRLVEELNALRAYHRAVVSSPIPEDVNATAPPTHPWALQYWDWQTVRRGWEHQGLGVDPRVANGCSAGAHEKPSVDSATAHRARRQQMKAGLEDFLLRAIESRAEPRNNCPRGVGSGPIPGHG